MAKNKKKKNVPNFVDPVNREVGELFELLPVNDLPEANTDELEKELFDLFGTPNTGFVEELGADNTEKIATSDETLTSASKKAGASEESAPTAEKTPIKEGSLLYMLRLVLVLTVICAVVAGMLAVVNNMTKDIIAENDRKAREAAVLTVFPEGDSCNEYITADGTTLYLAADGEYVIGYCVNVSPAGYSGDINMMVGISTDGTVIGIKIVSLSETPGVGTKVMGEGFLSQFLGCDKSVPLVIGENVDAIGGATFSSKAVVAGVNEALFVDFDLRSAAEEVGLKLSDTSDAPGNLDDYNDPNGDETLSAGEAGEVVETVAPGTSVETDSHETEPTETDPIETTAETEAPETEFWVPTPVETEPLETSAPETKAPETSAPETEPVETDSAETEPAETEAAETVPYETTSAETAPVETAAIETEPTETVGPTYMSYTMILKAVDADGNTVKGKLDGKLNGETWVASYYSAVCDINIGMNSINAWDEVPEGYAAPEDIFFVLFEDETIHSSSEQLRFEKRPGSITCIITLYPDSDGNS